MPETMRPSLNGSEQASIHQPLSQLAKLIPACDREREVDILGAALNGNSSSIVQVKVARESPDYHAGDPHRIECSHDVCCKLCMQTKFTSL